MMMNRYLNNRGYVVHKNAISDSDKETLLSDC